MEGRVSRYCALPPRDMSSGTLASALASARVSACRGLSRRWLVAQKLQIWYYASCANARCIVVMPRWSPFMDERGYIRPCQASHAWQGPCAALRTHSHNLHPGATETVISGDVIVSGGVLDVPLATSTSGECRMVRSQAPLHQRSIIERSTLLSSIEALGLLPATPAIVCVQLLKAWGQQYITHTLGQH